MYQLGIDLGTTYTAAAVHRDGRVEVVGLSDRAMVIPSVLYLRDDGEVLAGDAANRRGLTDPARAAREFKRRLGDPTPILVGGAPYGAEVLTARLLRWVIDRVAAREGAYPDALAVTHPANWGGYKLDLLRQAVDHAGFGGYPVTLLTEPEAAAVHYASQQRVPPGAAVAVYDLGGGTFDAAVLRRTESRFELLGRPQGIERLGGIDFDAAVLAHLDAALDGAVSALDSDDPDAIAATSRLRADVVDGKEALSSDIATLVPVRLPATTTTVRLTRSELEDLLRPALYETIGALRRAIDSAGTTAAQLHAVLLVGGSSRIPLVAELLTADLGRPVVVDAHPKHGVAQGAAIAAAQAAGAHVGSVKPIDESVAPTMARSPAGAAPLSWVAPSTGPVSAGGGAAPTGHRMSRAAVAVAGAGAIALVAAVAGGIALTGGGDDPDRTPVTQSPTTETATGAFAPVDLGDLWVVAEGGGELTRVDRDSGEALAAVGVGSAVSTPVVTDERMWTFDVGRGLLLAFDRESGEAQFTTPLQPTAPIEDPLAVSLVPTPTAIWVVLPGAGFTTQIIRVDEASGVADPEIRLEEPPDPSWLAVGEALVGTTLSATDPGDRLVRVDPSDGVVAEASIDADVVGRAVASDRLWLLTDGAVLEVDPETLEVVADPLPFPVADDPSRDARGFNVRGDDLWFFTSAGGIPRVGRVRTADRSLEIVEIDQVGTSVFSQAVPVTDDVALVPVTLDDAGVDAAVRVPIDGGEQELFELTPADSEPLNVFAAGDQLLILDSDSATFERTARLVGADGEEQVASLESRPLLVENAAGALIVTDRRDGRIARVTEEGISGQQDTTDFLGLPRVVGDEIWVPGLEEMLVFSSDLTDVTSFPVPEVTTPGVADDGTVFTGIEQVAIVDPVTHEATPAFAGSDFLGIDVFDPRFLPATSATRTLGFGAFWALAEDGVIRIDLTTGERRECATPAIAFDVSSAGGAIWVTSESGVATQLDPVSCEALSTVNVGDVAVIEGLGEDVVVAIELFGGEVHRIASVDGAPSAITETRLVGAGAVSFDAVGDRLWIAYESSRDLFTVDVEFALEVGDPIPLDGRPFGVAADEDGTWV
ncbi:MAG: Hsp70 family protein, partial [Acidimicrobiales bacterium]